MKPNIEHVPEPAEAEIQHAAYMLWIESGRPVGHDLEHWFAAKELLRHHHGRALQRHRAPLSAPTLRSVPHGSTNN